MIREPYIGMPIHIGITPGTCPDISYPEPSEPGPSQPGMGTGSGSTGSGSSSGGNGSGSGSGSTGSSSTGGSGSNGSGSSGSSSGSGNTGSSGNGSNQGQIGGNTIDNTSGRNYDARLLGSLPLAMAYTPMQQWKTTYSRDVALRVGTVFPELDLPFEGGMNKGGMNKGGMNR